MNVWHLSDPPSFSLPTTFKVIYMYSKQMRTQIFQGLNITKKAVKIFKNREIKTGIKAELEMIKKREKFALLSL